MGCLILISLDGFPSFIVIIIITTIMGMAMVTVMAMGIIMEKVVVS